MTHRRNTPAPAYPHLANVLHDAQGERSKAVHAVLAAAARRVVRAIRRADAGVPAAPACAA